MKTEEKPWDWTPSHEDFCLQKKLPTSAISLWRYILEERAATEDTIDLREFSEWIKKRRGVGYDRRTLKMAAKKLQEAEVLVLQREFTALVAEYLIRPLSELTQ